MVRHLTFLIRITFGLVSWLFLISPTNSEVLKDANTLSFVKNFLKTIKDDAFNPSYKNMIQDTEAEHSIADHQPNQPYFYSNDPIVLAAIINLVLEHPQEINDETQTNGTLEVYREFDFHKEIKGVIEHEPLFHRELTLAKKFQNDYLGQAATGPTNKVMVTIKVKGNQQNEETLKKRLVYKGNNIKFVSAEPVTGTPGKAKPKNAPKAEDEEGEEGEEENIR